MTNKEKDYTTTTNNTCMIDDTNFVRTEGNSVTTHHLKTKPCFFLAAQTREKLFQIRFNGDRGFQRGDKVVLEEYDDNNYSYPYSGQKLEFEITYVTNFKQMNDYVVFGLK